MHLKHNLVSSQQWEVNCLFVRLIFWVLFFLFYYVLLVSISVGFSLQKRNTVSLPFNHLTLHSVFLLKSSNCSLMSVFFHSDTLYNKVHQIDHWPNNLPTNQVALKFELIDFNVFSALCLWSKLFYRERKQKWGDSVAAFIYEGTMESERY